MSDLCASPFCHDIASPGRDLCAGCHADLEAERDRVEAEVRRLTVEHELLVSGQPA